jgi:transitional endoplasmic reticulum ATPase
MTGHLQPKRPVTIAEIRTLGRPALVRRSSDLIGSFVGESERAVAQAFEEARRDGAVLILDEVDSFLGSRESAVRRWEVSLVNELLQQIEDFEPGLFVATTNALDRIDEATMRRFDLKLEFRFLLAAQAGELMRRTCEQLGLYEPGCEALVTAIPRLTPGDFAAVIRQARLRPMSSAREVANRLQEEVGYKRGARQAIGFRTLSN